MFCGFCVFFPGRLAGDVDMGLVDWTCCEDVLTGLCFFFVCRRGLVSQGALLSFKATFVLVALLWLLDKQRKTKKD